MSSCAASYFTRCRVALCGSATSASSPTDSEQNSFHSVPDCSSHPIGQQQTPHHPRFPFVRCGNVRFAAETCKWSNASPPRNCSSDPRLISAGAPHESTTPTSNLARASARTLVLCLALVRSSMVLRSRLSDAPPHTNSLCHRLPNPKRSDRNGKLANDQDRLILIQIP